MNIQSMVTAFFQWSALIGAACLLGDTTAHSFGIAMALYCLMPFVKE